MFDIIHLVPDEMDNLLSTVDVPLKVVTDTDEGRDFISCDFNRDGDSSRSPFTSKYFPPLSDGLTLCPRLRKLEQRANGAFNAYRNLYFGNGAISSVYCWEIDTGVFGLGVFVKKVLDTSSRDGRSGFQGTIDCADVMEVSEKGGKATYTLTSSCLLSLNINIGTGSPLSTGGNLSGRKEVTKTFKGDDDHIINAGELVEGNARDFRAKMERMFGTSMKLIFDNISSPTVNLAQQNLAAGFRAAQAK